MKPPGISSGIRWCEVIALSDDKMLFIDPQKQVIELNSNKNLRLNAESRTEYHHFCSLDSLENILYSKTIKFNNIGNFDGPSEYERKNVAPEFWGQVFVACLTNKANSEELWEDFGDNGHGVRIDFTFPSIFHIDIFDKKRLVQPIGLNGEHYGEFGFSISSVKHEGITCNPNQFTQPIVDIILTDIAYTDCPKSSSVRIEDIRVLNLSNVSTEVPMRFWDEYETRVIGILRSTTAVNMKAISYLLIPIKLKYVKLTFGKRVCKEDRERYLSLLTRLKNEENKNE